MPGKLIASKTGCDALMSEPRDLAFSSDFELNKIARIKRFDNETALEHGFNYAPKFLVAREITSNPLKIGWGNECSVDDSKIYPRIVSHTTNFTKANRQTEDDSGLWVVLMVDNLTGGDFKKEVHGGIILVGNGESDYDYKIHSGYDTLKVFQTGQLVIDVGEFDGGSSGGVRTTTATFNHNLGYVPVFAPFVNYEISKDLYYSWNNQYNSRKMWSTGKLYYTGETVYVDPITLTSYVCIKTHTSSDSNKPETGVDWQTCWNVFYQDRNDTYLNNLEDIKYIYGGVAPRNETFFLYYATENQLVLSMVQVADPDGGMGPHEIMPAEKVSVDYTVFYNKLNEEIDLTVY